MQRTHVGVESLFLFKVNIDTIHFDIVGKYFPLKNYSVIEVTGTDRERFFNGQFSNDVSLLEKGCFQGQVRLDRTGRSQYIFYLLKEENNFYVLIESSLSDEMIEELSRYIIMDDVELKKIESSFAVVFGPHRYKGGYKGMIASLLAQIVPLDDVVAGDELSDEDYAKICLLGGEPVWSKTVVKNKLVTDSVAMLSWVSLDKGCFLGQETVAKIESRRGGAYFPMALFSELKDSKKSELDNESDFQYIDSLTLENYEVMIALLKREHRVPGKKIGVFTVKQLPLWESFSKDLLAEKFYEKGASLFQQGKDEEALKYLEDSILIDKTFADSYEAIGVILGRQEKYKEAIAYMDLLHNVDDKNVMAHTNKSLFYMKMGDIEKAEEEKSLATVKSFERFGREAQEKAKIEEEQKRKEEEVKKREGMFLQVLEIDPEDELALHGMADIYLHRKNYSKAIENSLKVIENNPSYSQSYLILGKSYIALHEKAKALKTLESGVSVAAKNGDLMPASEMQALINGL